MTESMKFGPEWLRSATDNCNINNAKVNSNVNSSLTAPRYQIAEHRYGREEMLALFDQRYRAPDILEQFTTIYIEKSQLPLALIQMTEEETRLWNGGVTNTNGRGRGSSVDRGGRGGRGRGSPYVHSRGVLFDDSGEGSRPETQTFPSRGRPFERPQNERAWSERNGGSEINDWNNSISPRKESGRSSVGNSSLIESNWRQQRWNEEDEEWRAAANSRGEKWAKTNWRDIDRERSDGDSEEVRSAGRWEHRGHKYNYDATHHPLQRSSKYWESNHHDNNDNLPEWVTENPSESGGRFDALGAFHGGTYSDEEKDTTRCESHRCSSECNNDCVKSEKSEKITDYENSNDLTNRSLYSNERAKLKSPIAVDQEESVLEESQCKSKLIVKSSPVLKMSTSDSLITLPPHENEKVVDVCTEMPKMTSEAIQGNKSGAIQVDEQKLSVLKPTIQELKDVESVQNTQDFNQKAEFPLDRMKEEADALVAKLMADETITKKDIRSSLIEQPSYNDAQQKWFYRDPQGEVQGPFTAAEMEEWCKQGYFNVGLMVRRSCDERFTTLGELMSQCGGVPFVKPEISIPPQKVDERLMQSLANTTTNVTTPNIMINKPGMENPVVLLQLQQLQMMQNQMFLGQMKHLCKHAIGKLPQVEHWSSLNPIEQTQLLTQYVTSNQLQPEIPEISVPSSSFIPPSIAAPPTNPVMQLINQMQQARTLPDVIQASSHSTVHRSATPMDSKHHIIDNPIAGTSIPHNIPPNLHLTSQDDSVKNLIRQLSNTIKHPAQIPTGPAWSEPSAHMATQFVRHNWLSSQKQCNEFQNLKQNQEIKEQRNEKEKVEEEYTKMKEKERQARTAEEHGRTIENEKMHQEDEKRKREEHKQKERKKAECRKLEEARKDEHRKLDELMQKKQEEERKKREELKKQEEKKKEEEKKKKAEEQAKLEMQRIKNEEALRRKTEIEEKNQKAEQRKREAEALRKLQERSKAPWAQTSHTQSISAHASLADIQKLEKEKKAVEQRLQQSLQHEALQQKTTDVQEPVLVDSSKKLQFRWAEKSNSSDKLIPVKSLAQIQQEEQEQMAKIKNLEKKKQDKVAHKETLTGTQNTGVWNTASETLNWNSGCGSMNQVWNSVSGVGGFWEDMLLPKSNQSAKTTAKPASIKISANECQQNQSLQPNSKTNKSKVGKGDDVVKKVLDQNTPKTDGFTQWCYKTLAELQVSVDVPTFVAFLRDIESAYEVKEYVRLYLGDSKQCVDFGKQFLEKRSEWRTAQRPQVESDDLCKPAPAVNPNTCTDFQEVKGKSRKPKKGKMFKVDNRILGFNVTSAPDRINVGDRDYGEGI